MTLPYNGFYDKLQFLKKPYTFSEILDKLSKNRYNSPMML